MTRNDPPPPTDTVLRNIPSQFKVYFATSLYLYYDYRKYWRKTTDLSYHNNNL